MVFSTNMQIPFPHVGATLPVANPPDEQFQNYASGLSSFMQGSSLLLNATDFKNRMTKGISDSLDMILPGSSPEQKQLAWKLASQSDDPIGVLRGYKGLIGTPGDWLNNTPQPGTAPQPSTGGQLPVQQPPVQQPQPINTQGSSIQSLPPNFQPIAEPLQSINPTTPEAQTGLPRSILGTGGLLAAAGIGYGIKEAFTPGVEKAEFTSSKPIFQAGAKGISKVAGPISQGGVGVIKDALPTGEINKITTPSFMKKLVSKQAWKTLAPIFSIPGLAASTFVLSGGVQDTLRFAGLEEDAQIIDQWSGGLKSILGKAGGDAAQLAGQGLNAVTGAFPQSKSSAEEPPITKQEIATTRTQTVREQINLEKEKARQLGTSVGALDHINNTLLPLYEKGIANGTVPVEEHTRLLNHQAWIFQDPYVQKEIAARRSYELANQSVMQDIPETPPEYEDRKGKIFRKLKGAERSKFVAEFLMKVQQGNIAGLENFVAGYESQLGLR